MERSQQPEPGWDAPRFGYRKRLTAFFSLAVIAGGSFALWSANQPSGHPAPQPGQLCDSMQLDNCAANTLDSAAGPQLALAATSRSPDSTSAGAEGPVVHEQPKGYLRGPRSWQDSSTDVAHLRPGYTTAELCAMDSDTSSLRCRISSAGEMAPGSMFSEADAEAGYIISGHVLTAEGAGLAGVSVVASPKRLAGADEDALANMRFWTMTDASGAYTLSGLPKGLYTIRSGNQGLYQSARVDARTGVRYADLVVPRNVEVLARGQVLSPQGEPLEGVTVAPVLLGQPGTVTNYDGRFSLSVMVKPTVESFAVRAQRPGYRDQIARISVRDGVAENAVGKTLILNPIDALTAVRGRVADDRGEPVAGLAVELRPPAFGQTHRATTNSRGEYTFSSVEFPADYTLVVRGGDNFKDQDRRVQVGAYMDALDVVVQAYEFGEVTGQLVNASGEPVPNFELMVRNVESRMPSNRVSTDTSGRFEIARAPAGDLVMASESSPTILVQGLQLESGDKLDVPLVLDWGEHEIQGVVVDANGNPVPASRIILQWSHRADGITTQATRRTASDTQGQFAFNNLGPGPHSLRIDAPGFQPLDINHDLRRQGYNLTVRLN